MCRLRHIGNSWLERMSLSQPERESTPLPRSAFRVAKNPGLRQKFAAISHEQFEKVFTKYAKHGQMSEAEFDLCLKVLGVNVPHLRARFFRIFDDSDSGFIEVREFTAGFQLLMADDRDKKLDLAFKMFDREGNGYISESEMRAFLATFFRVAEDGAQSVVHDFEALFGHDKSIANLVLDACRRLSTHYMDVVMRNIFSSQKLAAPGLGGQRRLFISDFKLWSAHNGDRIKDWLDSLGEYWLASIDKTVRGLVRLQRVVVLSFTEELWAPVFCLRLYCFSLRAVAFFRTCQASAKVVWGLRASPSSCCKSQWKTRSPRRRLRPNSSSSQVHQGFGSVTGCCGLVVAFATCRSI
eukprot:SAG11_NODE_3048_length_2733_cov_1.307897_2_plen_353_part_00